MRNPRRLALLALCVGTLMVAGAAQASAQWAGGGHCSTADSKHCYANAIWDPNSHRNISNAWGFISAEDMRWGLAGEVPQLDQVTMEMWVGWAEPGNVVGFPYSGGAYLEGGMEYTQEGHNSPLGEHNGGCHYFAAMTYTGGYQGLLAEQPCVTHTNALFKFTQSPDHRTECVWWGKVEAACVPATLCNELSECSESAPAHAWTEVLGGMEVADDYEPQAIQGKGEFFAQGGTNNWWMGKYHAEGIESPKSLCVKKFGTGNPAKIYFQAGSDCPASGRAKGEGAPVVLYNPEEPGFAATPFSETEAEDVRKEEGTEAPWCCATPPSSEVDPFANYSATGVAAQKAVEEKAVSLAEGLGAPEVEPPAVRRTTLQNAGISPVFVQASTPGQQAARTEKTFVVEVEDKPKIYGRADRNEYREELTGLIESPLESPTVGSNRAPEINLVYSAKTGALLEYSADEFNPRIEARKKLRKRNFEISYYLGEWGTASSENFKKYVAYCGKHPGAAECAETIEKYKWAKAEAIRKKTEEKERKRAEKKAIHKIEKEEQARAREEAKASVASVRSEKPNYREEVTLTELEIEAPESSAVIAVRRHGSVLHYHRGHHYAARLKSGRRYTIVARGAGFRCVKRVRVHAGESIRLRWPKDCVRSSQPTRGSN